MKTFLSLIATVASTNPIALVVWGVLSVIVIAVIAESPIMLSAIVALIIYWFWTKRTHK